MCCDNHCVVIVDLVTCLKLTTNTTATTTATAIAATITASSIITGANNTTLVF